MRDARPVAKMGSLRAAPDHTTSNSRAETSGLTMAETGSCVTIHMAASLDGFIARKEGSVDWQAAADECEDGETLHPESADEFPTTIDRYVMRSRTYETALEFEPPGFGWSYGDKPTFVLT